MNKKKIIIISILLFFTSYAQTIWYVDRDATGANTGRSWTDAWNTISDSQNVSTGINYAILQGGDTVYVSGGTDSTTYKSAFRIYPTFAVYGLDGISYSSEVVIAEAWQANHNGDVYITPLDNSTHWLMEVHNISNLKFTGFDIIDTRTADSDYGTMLYIGGWGVDGNYYGDSLITFDNCNIIGNGISSMIYLVGYKTAFSNNNIEQAYNSLPNDQDQFGMGGRGGHILDGNRIIYRNDYVAISGDGTGATYTSTSLTVSGLSMTTDYHATRSISAGGSSMAITSNDGTTFYGTGGWSAGTPANGTAWSVDGLAHRDMIQYSNYGDSSLHETVDMVIKNNLFLLPHNASAWNGVIYSYTPMTKTNWYIYNNIIAMNNTASNIAGLFIYSPDTSAVNSWTMSIFLLGNTIIGGNSSLIRPMSLDGKYLDTLVMKNNLISMDANISYFFSVEPFSYMDGLTLVPRVYYRDVDYNAYYELGGMSDEFSNGQRFGAYTYAQWLTDIADPDTYSLGYPDANSLDGNSNTVTFTNKFGENKTDYYTTAGRDSGIDLSTDYPDLVAKFPDLETDILGNSRSGSWDIGALEYQGATPVDSLPNAFSFTDITSATRSTVYTSNAVTLAGFDSAYARAGGAEYNVNGGLFVTGYTRVFPTDEITVRLTSSGSYSTPTNVTLTVGSGTDTYTVTTEAPPVIPPTGNGATIKDNNGVYLKDSSGVPLKVRR